MAAVAVAVCPRLGAACSIGDGPAPEPHRRALLVPAAYVGLRFGPTFGLLLAAEATAVADGPRYAFGGYGRVAAVDASSRASTWDLEAGGVFGPRQRDDGCSSAPVGYARLAVGLRGPLDVDTRTTSVRASVAGAVFLAGFFAVSLPVARGLGPEVSVGFGLGAPIVLVP